MNKCVSVCFFLLSAALLFSQNTESQMLSYRRNFVRANLNTKYELVRDASRNADETSTDFFLAALDFVDTSYELLENDPTLIQIACIAVETLSRLKIPEAVLPIRLLFMKVKDAHFQEVCVKAFQRYALTDEKLSEELNAQFEDLFYKSISGQTYPKPLFVAYIDCLGTVGNKESFSLLFKTFVQTGDTEIRDSAKTALSKISVNFFNELVYIIEKKDLYSTWAAFEIARENPSLSEAELAQITDLSLSVALDALPGQEGMSKKLIDEALTLLTEKRWQSAADSVISYFYRVQSRFRSGNAQAEDLVRVINCMAVLGSKECANALVVFLGLLNSDTEKGKSYSESVVLAVINAVGELGDNNAFDYLVYVGYLNYSETIKKAARESIARLKW